ncbi:CDP-alcohol phosphatidyltransferase family protein [Patescibacteria group bacterium]
MNWSKLAKQIPNLLTGLFMVGGVVGICVIYNSLHSNNKTATYLGAIIVILSFLGDMLDGWLARTNGWQTKFGSLWDPAADKVKNATLLGMLAVLGWFDFMILFIILSRDVVLSLLRVKADKEQLVMETSFAGKIRTNILGFGGGVLFFWNFTPSARPYMWGAIIVAAAVMTWKLFLSRKLKNSKVDRNMLEKIAVVVSLLIAAIYPPWSIPASMVVITLFTMVDYSKMLRDKAEEAGLSLKAFDREGIGYFMLAFTITGFTIYAMQVNFYTGIGIISLVLILLLFWNILYIYRKPKTSTPTSLSCKAQEEA